MKILHIINDAVTPTTQEIIESQSREHEVKVVELSNKDLSYESLIDDIFSHDRVVSW